MTNPSQDSTPGTVPLFTYTVNRTAKSLALGEPSWRFPCGLCNAGTVTEPGALCEQCSPTVEPSKLRRRPVKKTPAKKSGKTASKRVPPWDRVADQPDDQGKPRRGSGGDS